MIIIAAAAALVIAAVLFFVMNIFGNHVMLARKSAYIMTANSRLSMKENLTATAI